MTRRFSILLSDPDVQLDVLLERMPPLDIDTARMLRKENELNEAEDSEESSSESSSESSKEAIDSSSETSSDLPASPAADNVEDLLGLLDTGWLCALLLLDRTPRRTHAIPLHARSHRRIPVGIGVSDVAALAALAAPRGQRRSVQSARSNDRVQV